MSGTGYIVVLEIVHLPAPYLDPCAIDHVSIRGQFDKFGERVTSEGGVPSLRGCTFPTWVVDG